MPREPVTQISYGGESINGMGFDHENAWLAVGPNGGGANVIDCNNNFEEIIEFDSTVSTWGWADFTRDNSLVAIYDNDSDDTRIWEVGDANGNGWNEWTNAAIPDGNSRYSQWGFSYDNQHIAVHLDDTELRWGFFEIGGDEPWIEVGSLSTPEDSRGGYFHPNGYFISTQRDASIQLLEQGTWDVLDTNTQMSSIYRVAPDPTGSPRFLVGAYSDDTHLFEITENEELNVLHTFDTPGDSPGVAWSHTGTELYTNSTAENDRLYSADEPYDLIDDLAGSLGARASGHYSADNNWLAVGDSDDDLVTIYDADLQQAPDVPTDLSAVFV